jgi:hypothetical protein
MESVKAEIPTPAAVGGDFMDAEPRPVWAHTESGNGCPLSAHHRTVAISIKHPAHFQRLTIRPVRCVCPPLWMALDSEIATREIRWDGNPIQRRSATGDIEPEGNSHSGIESENAIVRAVGLEMAVLTSEIGEANRELRPVSGIRKQVRSTLTGDFGYVRIANRVGGIRSLIVDLELTEVDEARTGGFLDNEIGRSDFIRLSVTGPTGRPVVVDVASCGDDLDAVDDRTFGIGGGVGRLGPK